MLATGDELATAANKALGSEMKFEDISEYSTPASLSPLNLSHGTDRLQ